LNGFPLTITDRALEALRAEGLEPSRTVLVVQHVLGCGGSGYRLAFRDTPLDDGRTYVAEGGLTISMDEYAFARISGGAIDYDKEKETEGYWLDHPDAAFAAFC